MNRRKVRVVAKQPKTLEAIFKLERTGRNKNKKKELTQERWRARRKHL